MLNKVLNFLRRYEMVQPGNTVTAAVSGGADSVALLYALFLLQEKLDIRLQAVHYNHHLRGEESDRDEAFVRDFCHRYDIPLLVAGGQVSPGKKGLEAAAREARYDCFAQIPGKIATAHTADDNAETVLMHLVRGTGLKGLGGIAPVRGSIIRPMLEVTRQEVLEFLQENFLSHVEDSSNSGDDFLRNRLRHHVMPLLYQENPQLAENLSTMALRLREDEDYLTLQAKNAGCSVNHLREQHPAVRSRALDSFLKESGVREPEAEHIALVEALVFSGKPSAKANFPGGITIARKYDTLEVLIEDAGITPVTLPCPGQVDSGDYRISCRPAEEIVNNSNTFTVCTHGPVTVRPRMARDTIRLSAGTKRLKKLFIDKKIPASSRERIPVITDSDGVLVVCGIGVNLDRMAENLPAVQIHIEKRS